MVSTPRAFGYAANLGIPLLLATIAFQLWRRRGRLPALRWLAPYLALVALGYALDSASVALNVFADDPVGSKALFSVVVALSRFDAAPLLLFALELRGARPPRAAMAVLFVPGAALALLGDAAPGPAVALHLVAYYGSAFVLVALAYLEAPTVLARDRLGVLVLAASVVVLPRIPLLYLDLGHGRGAAERAQVETVLPLEGLLALTTGLAVLGLLLRAPSALRAEARRLALSLAALMLVVDAVWLMRFLPGLRDTAYTLAYSARWFLFGLVLAVGDRRHAVFDVAGTNPARIALAAALGGLAVAHVGVLLSGLDGVSAPLALLGGVAVVGLAALTTWGVRRAFPPLDADALRRREAFRAQAALASSPSQMERLRAAWGLDEEEAERLAREAPLGPAVAWPSVGAVFASRYGVEDLAGAGGFGRAFTAWDRARGERVVLKELVGPPDPEAEARLAVEVEALARLSHPNLVGFRGLERGARGPVLVLEHVEGETLRARLARGPLPAAQARRLAADLLGALGALHRAGVLHRDVKPENVVLRGDGAAVLLDFGAASLARAGATRAASTGPHPGTPAYMSPEQARGDGADARADLYAVGVVVWEALAGLRPPEGPAPEAWRRVLARALADDPRERWPDAESFLAALPR